MLGCSFDDFLMDLKQSKRKNIRQERKKVVHLLVMIPHVLSQLWLLNMLLDCNIVQFSCHMDNFADTFGFNFNFFLSN